MNISVIIPVYNCEQYLAEAITSVLCQTRPAEEIIVVDDGSTDGSADVAHRFVSQVRYIRIDHAGIGAARNTGIQIAAGDCLAFLDSDDHWPENKLEIQTRRWADSTRPAMIFGKVKQFISPELAPEVAARLHCPPDEMRGFVAGTMLTHRDVFAAAGLFNQGLSVAEFIDWHARATDSGFRSETIDEVLLHRRIHSSNTGVRERHMRKDYVHVLKAALDRRRAAG